MRDTTSGRHLARTGKGRFDRTIDTAEKDAEAACLKAQGLTYNQIAEQLGYHDRSGAHKAVQRALRAVPAASVAELRTLETERLDAIEAKAWEVVGAVHYKVSNSGKVVMDPDTDRPLIDPAPTIAALTLLVKLSARRSALAGLDAPTRSEVEITLEQATAVLDSEIARLRNGIAEEQARHTLTPHPPLQLPPGHPERLN